MKNLTQLIREYGPKRVARVFPYMEAVYDAHVRDDQTYQAIADASHLTRDDAILAMDIAVAVDLAGERLKRDRRL